jgi:hypothetical protein
MLYFCIKNTLALEIDELLRDLQTGFLLLTLLRNAVWKKNKKAKKEKKKENKKVNYC